MTSLKPYYQKDGITILNGDCLELIPLLIAARPSWRVDHIITDPPYEAQAHTMQRRIKVKSLDELDRLQREGKGPKYTPLNFAPISESDRLSFGPLAAMITKRWCLTFCQVEAAHKWITAYEGMTYKRTAVWIKPDGQPNYSGDKPGMGFETIVIMHAANVGKSRWNGGGRVGVWSYSSPKNSPHQTTKPLPLMRELVRLFTDPGETIFDPFMGSGTTLLAAKQLGRKAIGIELEQKWCDLAVARLEAVGSTRFRNTNGREDALIERGYKQLI